MDPIHPAHGARFVLERTSVDDAGAHYRVHVYEPADVSHTTVARLGGDGPGGNAVELDAWTSVPAATEPPAWARAFADRLLQTTAKKHTAGAWPRKITRWREAR